jgi:hypothetical protein
MWDGDVVDIPHSPFYTLLDPLSLLTHIRHSMITLHSAAFLDRYLIAHRSNPIVHYPFTSKLQRPSSYPPPRRTPAASSAPLRPPPQ